MLAERPVSYAILIQQMPSLRPTFLRDYFLLVATFAQTDLCHRFGTVLQNNAAVASSFYQVVIAVI